MNLPLETIILNIIRIYGDISRKDIAEKLDISMTAVSNYVLKLINEGLVEETGKNSSTGGRKSIQLKVRKDNGYVIVMDFGPKIFRIASGDLEGNILYKEEMPSANLGNKSVGIEKIKDLIREFKKKDIVSCRKFVGIGMAISAIVDENNGICLKFPNLKGWDDVDFKKIFEDEFRVNVYIGDKSRLSALAESIKKDGRIKNLIYINLDVGVGSGIIINGRIFGGEGSLAGEIGHIIVEENGIQCGCGNRGCLEQYVAVPSMVRRIIEGIDNGVSSIISDYTNGDMSLITPELISKAVKEKDKLAYVTILEAGNFLGIGMAHLVTIFNPSLIIVGGSGIEIADEILEEAERVINVRAVNQSAKEVRIIKSSLGEEAALKGTIIMVLDNYFGLNEIIGRSIFDLI